VLKGRFQEGDTLTKEDSEAREKFPTGGLKGVLSRMLLDKPTEGKVS